ncbi:hypothetical protein [Methanopyrus kandleri]|uniref:Uncharacterized protein n=1 Tax=Methanopyrus kandleri TaxID=2320 RepID=A0A832T9E8_9EURY|nr:hypothetical protein [Methanopyrus kandleri]HII70540.1 hypothetical protein [Methanopyrus kandleri]
MGRGRVLVGRSEAARRAVRGHVEGEVERGSGREPGVGRVVRSVVRAGEVGAHEMGVAEW